MSNITASNNGIIISADVDVDDDEYYTYMASRTQQLIVSSIQIPTSILSLVGSSLIIINVRSIRKKTPYRRILLALSTCDIISTIGWLLQPFLADQQVPDAWVWSIGNHASCVMLGSLTQFGTPSAHLYSLFLAVYFLMTVRFGMKERNFEKKYERWIHGLIIFFSISTAIAGIFLGIFRPSILAPGCWISAPAEGCSEDCPEAKWAWFFGGLPTILTLVGITISNTMLYLHVRRTVMEGEKRALANEQKMKRYQQESAIIVNTATTNNNNPDETYSSAAAHENTTRRSDKDEMVPSSAINGNKSQATSTMNRSVLRSSDKQWKRVQEVGKQAFLYVGAYFLSFSWSFALNYLDSIDYEYKRGSGNILFPLLVLQAMFAPIFGMFTGIIFFRPKLQAARIKFPDEPFWWVFQQVVTGNADGRTNNLTRPSSATSTASNNNHNNKNNNAKRRRRRRRPKKSSSWIAQINFAGEGRLSTGSFRLSSRWLSNSSNLNNTNSSIDGGLHIIDESQQQQQEEEEESNKNDEADVAPPGGIRIPASSCSSKQELDSDILRENDGIIEVKDHGLTCTNNSSKKEEETLYNNNMPPPPPPRSSKKMDALDHQLIAMSDDEDEASSL